MEGYIYCFSNPAFINLYKVGFTTNTPNVRKKQINTTGVPLPFKLEFAKKVINYKDKEKTIHKILSIFGERINPKREFFKINLDYIYLLFELIDGDWYEDNDINNDNNEDSDN